MTEHRNRYKRRIMYTKLNKIWINAVVMARKSQHMSQERLTKDESSPELYTEFGELISRITLRDSGDSHCRLHVDNMARSMGCCVGI